MSTKSLQTPQNVGQDRQRAVIALHSGGANRGARGMLPAIRDYNLRSCGYVIEPVYVDPHPERATALAADALKEGILALAVETRIEDHIDLQGPDIQAPVVLHLDKPGAVASALTRLVGKHRACLGYMLILLPRGELTGLRFHIMPDEDSRKCVAVEFFRRLNEVTARGGSDHVIGRLANPEHIAIEPAIRKWFADHLQKNLPKIAAGIEPDGESFEITADGLTTVPLTFLDSSGHQWEDPADLATRFIEQPSIPLARGQDFAIAETADDAIRIHRVRMRRTDGKPALMASSIIDASAFAALREEEQERARREAAESVRRAERETISRRQPIFTTD